MMNSLYLVPVSDDWFDRFEETVGQPISIEKIPSISEEVAETDVRIWGATEGPRNQGFIESMRSTDWLLFYNGGRYFAAGRVGDQFESSRAGEAIWDNPQSRYLYTVKGFQRLSIHKRNFNEKFEYRPKFVPQGLHKVTEDTLSKVTKQYESIDDLIEELDMSASMTEPAYLVSVVKLLINNYESKIGPFSTNEMPEKDAIEGINDRDSRALFLTLSVAIDFNRNARSHWRKCRELWDEYNWTFDPEQIVESYGQSQLEDLFREKGMRYGKGDARYWYQNAETLYRQYNSDPIEFLEEYDFDAPEILNAVRRNSEFKGLGGDTVGPLWIRLLHEDVHELQHVNEIEIPSSENTVTTTNAILGTNYNSEQVRRFWNRFSVNYGIDPVKIDQPLWLVGSNWGDWGAGYLESQLEETKLMNQDRDEYPSLLFPNDSEPTEEGRGPRTLSPITREAEEIKYEISDEIVSYEFDYEALNQATQRHEAVLLQFSRLLTEHEFECYETVNSDLIAAKEDSIVLSEVKTLRAENQKTQIRKAVGQLLEYSYFDVELRNEWSKKEVYRCILFDRSPSEKWNGYFQFLEGRGIHLLWYDGEELTGKEDSFLQLQSIL